MLALRLLTLGPDNEALWVRLYVREVGDAWTSMIVADEALPPGPGELKGMAFFGNSVEEAEQQARAYLGMQEPVK